MTTTPLRRFHGPTLVVQIVMLLLGGLVIAQVVTLLLTLLLPPAPAPQYHLDSVAAALRGGRVDGNLRRIVQSGPPDLGGRGWLMSERSRHDLAEMLNADPVDVRLSFYTPLPFAGTVATHKLAMANDGPIAPSDPSLRLAGFDAATNLGGHPMASATGGGRLILAQATVPPRPTGGAGGLILPNGRMLPQSAGAPSRDMLPPEGLPQGRRPRRPEAGGLPSGGGWRGNETAPLFEIDPSPLQGRDGLWIGGDRGETVPPILGGPRGGIDVRRQPPVTIGGETPAGVGTGGTGSTGGTGTNGGTTGTVPVPRSIEEFQRDPSFARPPVQQMPGFSTMPIIPSESLRATPQAVIPQGNGPAIDVQRVPTPFLRPGVTAQAPAAAPSGPIMMLPPPAAEGAAGAMAGGAVLPPPPPYYEPVPLVPRARGLFGLALAPFVEGDFVAALRLPDGRWSVVQPAPEPFPNSWQRRVLLWFLMAFAIVAPLGWLFARRMSKPLVAFAEAAEQLGRDPTAPVLDLDGPAEVGRAAHAFNLMQSRLKSFVGDRTAMIGAISHDLRTPLTRLRFRIEEVEDEAVRDGMIEEVEEMEEMINSVLAFIRDASSPGVRERIDLRAIVEDVAEDAAVVGNAVTLEPMAAAPVDVDVMGMRRLFANLFENAAKYGDHARVRLSIADGEAVAEVFDAGPGVPSEDLERAFEPFYRAANARTSDKRGSGLGLAVCRSIARAHGGDVRLKHSEDGFAAEVKIPLAYQAKPAEPVAA